MIKEILYKMFGIEPMPCPTCEVLQMQLENEQRRSSLLLDRLLMKDLPTGITPESPLTEDEVKPIGARFTPWRVRQAHLEAEDRAKAEVLRKNREEVELAKKKVATAQPAEIQSSIEKLEKELGIKEA